MLNRCADSVIICDVNLDIAPDSRGIVHFERVQVDLVAFVSNHAGYVGQCQHGSVSGIVSRHVKNHSFGASVLKNAVGRIFESNFTDDSDTA